MEFLLRSGDYEYWKCDWLTYCYVATHQFFTIDNRRTTSNFCSSLFQKLRLSLITFRHFFLYVKKEKRNRNRNCCNWTLLFLGLGRKSIVSVTFNLSWSQCRKLFLFSHERNHRNLVYFDKVLPPPLLVLILINVTCQVIPSYLLIAQHQRLARIAENAFWSLWRLWHSLTSISYLAGRNWRWNFA